MSVMDNEGHDPQGLGNVLSHIDANDLRSLRAENEQLRIQRDFWQGAYNRCNERVCELLTEKLAARQQK